MTDIILARHGETEWNVAEVFRGRIDVALNETGLKQAELLAEYLEERKLVAVYSGPLKRALAVAGAIARRHNLEVITAPALNDLDFGKWQGLPRREVAEKYPESYTSWLDHPEQVQMPSGESLGDVRERVVPFIRELVDRHTGTVVLVSHRVVIKVLICALLGLDNTHFWNIKMDTCAITTFSHENGRFIMDEHNNTSYLKLLKKAPLTDF